MSQQDLSLSAMPRNYVRVDAVIVMLEKQARRLLLRRFFDGWLHRHQHHHRLGNSGANTNRESSSFSVSSGAPLLPKKRRSGPAVESCASDLVDDLSAIEQQLHQQLAQAQSNTLRTPHQQHVVLLSSIESMRRTVAKQREIIVAKDQAIVSLSQRLAVLQQTLQAQQQHQIPRFTDAAPASASSAVLSSLLCIPILTADHATRSQQQQQQQQQPFPLSLSAAPEKDKKTVSSSGSTPVKQAMAVEKLFQPPALSLHPVLSEGQQQQIQEQQQKGLLFGIGVSGSAGGSSVVQSAGTARRIEPSSSPSTPQQQLHHHQHQQRPATTSSSLSSSSSAAAAAAASINNVHDIGFPTSGNVISVNYAGSSSSNKNRQHSAASAAAAQTRLTAGNGIKLAGAPISSSSCNTQGQQQQHLLFMADRAAIKSKMALPGGQTASRNVVTSVLVGSPTAGHNNCNNNGGAEAAMSTPTTTSGKPFSGGIQGSSKNFAAENSTKSQQQQQLHTFSGTGIRVVVSSSQQQQQQLQLQSSAVNAVVAPGVNSSRRTFREL